MDKRQEIQNVEVGYVSQSILAFRVVRKISMRPAFIAVRNACRSEINPACDGFSRYP